MQEVPGTKYTVRIENPHNDDGSQVHAHVYDEKGNKVTVVSQDGGSSHNSCPTKELPKNRKLLVFLKKAGFTLEKLGLNVVMDAATILEIARGVVEKQCYLGDIQACQTLRYMYGTPVLD